MEFLRLPPALRCGSLIQYALRSQFQRTVITSTRHAPARDDSALLAAASSSESSADVASPPLLALTSSNLNSYTLTQPPNSAQLKYAASYFQASPPEILYSAAHFRDFPPSSFPEIAFLGRSNVGKSSLLNALFGRTKVKSAHVSKRPGRTRTMNGFGVTGGAQFGTAPKKAESDAIWRRFPRGGLIVVDMPGYGGGSREDWGTEALKYLERRKQLRRTILLVDAAHGLKASDITLLTHLRRLGISHQIVLSKVDKLLYSGSKPPGPQKLHNGLLELRDLRAGIQQRLNAEIGDRRYTTGDILCCSAEKSMEGQPHRKLGVDEVRWAVLSACGLESDSMGQRKRSGVSNMPILDNEK